MSASATKPLGTAEYADLVARIHAAVAATVPPGSSVLVISKGDAALLAMPGLSAAHFPQDGSGEYAGHHPLDGAAATAALEELRRSGAEYLVLPATARWWLDYYGELATHLATHCRLVHDDPDSCLIYGLAGVAEAGAAPAGATGGLSGEQMRDYLEHLLSGEAALVVLDEAGDDLAELERLAASGADYLVVPRTADERFERGPLSEAIEASCRKVADQRHLCRVFDLNGMRGPE